MGHAGEKQGKSESEAIMRHKSLELKEQTVIDSQLDSGRKRNDLSICVCIESHSSFTYCYINKVLY